MYDKQVFETHEPNNRIHKIKNILRLYWYTLYIDAILLYYVYTFGFRI